ncbi:hypothetical protein CAY60_018180 [Shouchella clausii]|nr:MULTISPECIES: hypothetical protein [Shouchella]MBU3231057.1 hypothetical protein [Shouchella clausii]MBU3262868.1 hypothetical protein [Shouchella clausii]MBU3505332.1 hypothetical protein [Shouchella clausii]MBU3534898.1 hypothetical protein [Shouchella clausii]MBX0310068.1 hypothetical protein [Shouchella clausii]
MKDNSRSFLSKLVAYLNAVDGDIMGEESSNEDSSLHEDINPIENLEKTLKEIGEVSSLKINFRKGTVKAEKEFKELIDSLKTTIDRDKIPYSKITDTLFNVVKNEEFLDLIGDTIQKNWEHYELNYKPDEDLRHKFFKLNEHISLSVIQRTHINDRLKSKIEEVEGQLRSFKKQVERYKKELDEVREEAQSKTNSMITQFIGILGIFSAVLMGAFGSIQGFTSLFNNANNIPLGKLIVISSLGCITVMFILFFLLHSLGKMTGFNLSSCNCYRVRVRPRKKGILGRMFEVFETNSEEDTYCKCSPIEKYPLLIYVTYFLITMVLLGIMIMLWTSNEDYLEFLQTDFGPFASSVVLIMVSGLSLAFIHKKFLGKKRING